MKPQTTPSHSADNFGTIINAINKKVISCRKIQEIVHAVRTSGKTIGFTNGCFDCCHLGHIRSLQNAKALCDILIVGVNSDKWIQKHKGSNRPLQDELTRVTLIASLSFVDYVVVFGSETALPLVRKIRPDVIAKEGYALENWPEGRFVNRIGGQVVTIKRIAGYSTSNLAAKLK